MFYIFSYIVAVKPLCGPTCHFMQLLNVHCLYTLNIYSHLFCN
uniref:Uncharacterized protein n=1 Tax=Arundo donax TaxID=35708 RepID=A0A0A8YDK6_ARUDO